MPRVSPTSTDSSPTSASQFNFERRSAPPSPGAPSFVRGLDRLTQGLMRRLDSVQGSPEFQQARAAAQSFSRQGRDIRAVFSNAGDRLALFNLHDQFKESINSRNLDAVHRGLHAGVSFQYKSTIGGETWGHRIARMNPYGEPARQIMRLIFQSRDLRGHSIDWAQGDSKRRTPAHFAAARNNQEFFKELAIVAKDEPLRDFGLNSTDYKGRTCDSLSSDPAVRAKINEIRQIQADARANLFQANAIQRPPHGNDPQHRFRTVLQICDSGGMNVFPTPRTVGQSTNFKPNDDN